MWNKRRLRFCSYNQNSLISISTHFSEWKTLLHVSDFLYREKLYKILVASFIRKSYINLIHDEWKEEVSKINNIVSDRCFIVLNFRSPRSDNSYTSGLSNIDPLVSLLDPVQKALIDNNIYKTNNCLAV